jgi:L-asparaginase
LHRGEEYSTMTFSDRTVTIFSLGGTIAMAPDPAGGSGVVPALSARDLLAAVPQLNDSGATLRVRDFRRVPGASLTVEDISALRSAIADELANGADGAVVTQGTDTIEETAFLIDLLHDREEPVVVTGAMRNPTLPGADGPANLFGAVLTAADPAARGIGCLVVLNDEIHGARVVRKTHTTSTAAFASPGSGPLGRITEGRVSISASPTIVPLTNFTDELARNVRIPLYTVALGDDGSTLAAFSGSCDGLVVAAFGVGHVPQSMVAGLESLAAEIPVVLTSRIGSGPVLRETYGFPGSERDLRDRGLIGGGDLAPYKARLLLHLLIANERSRGEILDAFASFD